MFKDFKLRIVKPDFDTNLTTIIMELEHLRKLRLSGSTNPKTFFELKDIFHLLESIGSARIEGNQTTVSEYVEAKLEESRTKTPSKEERFLEIENMTKAMEFIEEFIETTTDINHNFILELHELTVKNLSLSPKGEGDPTPGEYRKSQVKINNSKLVVPAFGDVRDYMEELFEFINYSSEPKYDLLKSALAHHRFCWIHPFNNGNGRTVRLLTYAMLIKQGFQVKPGGLINPAAVFCSDRDEYYELLGKADTGEDQHLTAWCEYVLGGLKDEILKVDKLTNHSYLSEKILLPAIEFSLERKTINKLEADILKIAVKNQTFQAADIAHLMPDKTPPERSRLIGRLKSNNLIEPLREGGREYIINLDINNYLTRGIISSLLKEGFIGKLNEKE